MRVLTKFVNNLVSFNIKKARIIELQLYTPKLIVRIGNRTKECTARVIKFKELRLETMDNFGLFSLNSLRRRGLSFLMNC